MSARKDVLRPYKIITAGDMSTASITSQVTNIQWIDNVGLQLQWTGTPVGTFAVQGSIDYAQDTNGNVTNSGTWTAVTLSPSPAATGAAGQILIDMNQLSWPYIRVVYTKGSSVGTLTAYITGKQL